MTNELQEVTKQTPIEIALKIDEDGYTTAKRLYEFLELDRSHYTRWYKTNIIENEFAEEGTDYIVLASKGENPLGGRPTQNFKLIASFAKKLSMMQKTERGEEARNYFLGCEEGLKLVAVERQKKEIERAKGIAVRQALTKSLQQSTENERMHGHAYSTYTNCIYKVLFGMNAKQLREKYGIGKKDNLRDCFDQEELKAIQSMESMISGLVDCGWGYDQVKAFIENTNTKMLAS